MQIPVLHGRGDGQAREFDLGLGPAIGSPEQVAVFGPGQVGQFGGVGQELP